MVFIEPWSLTQGNVSYVSVGLYLVQSDRSNRTFSPVVHGRVVLSTNTQYKKSYHMQLY